MQGGFSLRRDSGILHNIMTTQPGPRERDNFDRLLTLARQEDLGATGDVTSLLLPADVLAVGEFVAREELVFCGGAFLDTVAAAYDQNLSTEIRIGEGQFVAAGTVLANWRGPARTMMSAERVALNFLQRLSGVATVTRLYVDEVAGTDAAILDTRKTTPGWRELEKYAVRTGGGRNHRHGLYDAVLVKDNHLAVLARAGGAGSLEAIGPELDRLRSRLPEGGFVEVEVDTLDQLAVALTLPVDVIMLDNMQPRTLTRAVAMRDQAGADGRISLEASGGITLESVRLVAEAGVDLISVGALTHSARAVDIALDIELG